MPKKIHSVTLKDMLENYGKPPEPDLTEFKDSVNINTLSEDQQDSVFHLYEIAKHTKEWISNVLNAETEKNNRELFLNSMRVGFTTVKRNAIFNPKFDNEISKVVVNIAKKEIKHYKRITKYRDPVENV